MLPSVNRLNKQKDFEAVFSGGKIRQNSFFLIRSRPIAHSFSRFGLIVSARVSKKAVTRNRLRRQMSEIIRLNLKKIKNGFDIVLVAKSKLCGVEYKEIENSLLDLLKSMNMYI